MMADDAQLLAYVDGGLSPEDRSAVEAQLRESAEARAKVALLRASRLDFEDAFAQQKLPPVPDSLKLKVDEMVRAHRARESNDPVLPPGEKAPSEPVRSRLRAMPV